VFALRGIAISFSVFVLVYCAFSFAVCAVWRSLNLYLQRYPARRVADLLFALRLLPLVSAVVVTAVFTVPSFLLLEPRAIDEPVGAIPLALGLCGAILGIFGIMNAFLAMRRAARAIAGWTREAQPIAAAAPIPVLRISPNLAAQNELATRTVPSQIASAQITTAVLTPAMIAAGIARPRVLVSAAVESMLSVQELRSALNHEVAHVRRRDNLKKLLLCVVAFPGMAALEAAWLEATEMAADDAAVANAAEALDLASALIKLSRIASAEPSVDLTAALLHSPALVLNSRVERLIAWNERGERHEPNEEHGVAQRRSPWYGLAVILTATAVFAVTYSQLLVHIHTATEWLVR
jgi:Zn-dependent protease with chaperone function